MEGHLNIGPHHPSSKKKSKSMGNLLDSIHESERRGEGPVEQMEFATMNTAQKRNSVQSGTTVTSPVDVPGCHDDPTPPIKGETRVPFLVAPISISAQSAHPLVVVNPMSLTDSPVDRLIVKESLVLSSGPSPGAGASPGPGPSPLSAKESLDSSSIPSPPSSPPPPNVPRSPFRHSVTTPITPTSPISPAPRRSTIHMLYSVRRINT